jgi:type II secretory ATPase GspE/PulE/Tfp pilus assembly ATPase PilB-like protein
MTSTTIAGSETDTTVATGGTMPMLDVGRLTPEQGVAKLIDHAVKLGASDLFICSNDQHVAVTMRHLGIVRPLSVLMHETGKRFLAHMKAAASMDVTERRRPSDGRWIFKAKDAAHPDSTVIDLRINSIPTLYGEDCAIRLLVRGSKLFALENLGMNREQLNGFLGMINNPGGLVLITGPTGSGKSSTLYSALIRLNDGKRKIHTIEDPIEYAIDGLHQSQVNSAIDLGFSELLRGVLRQSPDVVMLGEIRDEETARTAVHAANSGILVFATLHAPSAPAAIQSMRSLGANSTFLANSLRGVIGQRLVRTLCSNCKQGFDLTDAPHTFDDVRPWLGADEGKMLFAARGCDQCHATGYSGRTGLFEILPVTIAIRALISENAPTRAIRAKAIEEKMAEFRQSAMLKVARGETSTEEVFRVIPVEHLVDED